MSKKSFLKGLSFYYMACGSTWSPSGEKALREKYQTIEDFLNEAELKTHSLAPKLDDEIHNVRWNGSLISLNHEKLTVASLLSLIRSGEVVVTKKDIRRKGYDRKCIIPIEEVEAVMKDIVCSNINTPKTLKVNGKKVMVTIRGEEIHALSDRYKLFFTKGYTCVDCGIVGQYFALERNWNIDQRYHLNLYGIDENGEEVQFTKDHIIPKSLGGKNQLDNYQTMCKCCNNKKGNSNH